MNNLVSNITDYTANGDFSYPGYIGGNNAIYSPEPDPSDPYFQLQSWNARGFARDSAVARGGYQKVAMFYASASNGWLAYKAAMSDVKQVLRHSDTYRASSEDARFMTTQSIKKILPPDTVMGDIFSRNERNNQLSTLQASQNMPDTVIVAPSYREAHLKALKDIPAILRESMYEDATFEKDLWLPFCLLEATTGIYYGDHAWSRNAAPEKEIASAIQYGLKAALEQRQDLPGGPQFDVVDIYGEAVPLLDQAWEDARHIVDVVSRPIEFEGNIYRFRTDPAVALLAVRFMRDAMYRDGSDHIAFGQEHEIVMAHYAYDDYGRTQQAKMAHLQGTMKPFLATFCDNPTFRKILDNDTDLSAYWDTEIVPCKTDMTPEDVEAVRKAIFAYLPKGGFDHPELRNYVTDRAPVPKTQKRFNNITEQPRPKAVKEVNAYSSDNDNRRFEDRKFARLGATSNPKDDPKLDHLTPEQCACIMVLNAFRDGLRPVNTPNMFLYLDEAESGVFTDRYMQENDIRDLREAPGSKDPLAPEGNGFYEAVIEKARQAYQDRHDTLRGSTSNIDIATWRTDYKIGTIISASELCEAMEKFGQDDWGKGIAAEGSRKVTREGKEALIRRYIDLMEPQGIIIPDGSLTGKQAGYITEAVMAAVGFTQPGYAEGERRMAFFLDKDYEKAVQEQGSPQPMDLGDIILHLGFMIKGELESNNPAPMREHYVAMARLLDIYEMIMDPERRNVVSGQNEFTGKATHEHIIDMNIVDPALISFIQHDPDIDTGYFVGLSEVDHQRPTQSVYDHFVNSDHYQSFRNNELDDAALEAIKADPARKAELVKMMWFWMAAEKVSLNSKNNNGIVEPPVGGNLIVKGIASFDHADLVDLPEKYSKAFDWQANRLNLDTAAVLGREGIDITKPNPR